MSSTVDQTELAELSKFMNRSKTNDIRAYDKSVTEETLKRGGSLKATKGKLAIGKDRIWALRDEQSNVTHNIFDIIKVAE